MLNKLKLLVVGYNAVGRLVFDILQEKYIILKALNDTNNLQLIENFLPEVKGVIIFFEEFENEKSFQILKYIKTIQKFKNLPVIMAADTPSEDAINTAFELGAADFLQALIKQILLINACKML